MSAEGGLRARTYFASLHPDGRLAALRMVPLRLSKLRLAHAPRADAAWLKATLARARSIETSSSTPITPCGSSCDAG